MPIFKNSINDSAPIAINKKDLSKNEDNIFIFNIYNIGHFRFKYVKSMLISINPINKLEKLMLWWNNNSDLTFDCRNIPLSTINKIYETIFIKNKEYIDYKVPEGILWEYVRDNKGECSNAFCDKINEMFMNNKKVDYTKLPNYGNPIGIICSKVINGEIEFGYSLCNIKSGDIFNFKDGMELAISRCHRQDFDIPKSIQNQFSNFMNRSYKYFKQHNTNICISEENINHSHINLENNNITSIITELLDNSKDGKLIFEKKENSVTVYFVEYNN